MTELFFWNKYKPKKLDDIYHNGRSVLLLKRLSADTNISHIYITGLQTNYTALVANLLVKNLYKIDELRIKRIKFTLTSSITVEINSSEYHYEFDMNYYKYMRRDIPLLIINNIVRHKNISNNSYNIIIIQNANLMTYNVQAAFRRLMEKNISSCRFILISKNGNGIMEALRSRCINICFNKPSFIHYRNMLNNICVNEKIKIKDSVYEDIYENSDGIIDGINLLQLYSLNKDAIQYKKKHSPYKEIVFYIKKGDIRYFSKIQDILFVLHSLDIIYTDVIKNIVTFLVKGNTNMKKISKILSIAAECDWRCACSNRTIIGLNLFIGKLIKLYEKK